VACPGFAAFEGNAVSNCAGFGLGIAAAGVSTFGLNNRLDNNAFRGIEITGGNVTSTTTWPFNGFPYCVAGSVGVSGPSNPLLTIAAGCSLLFCDSVRLRVGVGQPGGLRCDGTFGRITFSGFSSAPAPGSWRGIEFWEESDPLTCVLRFCTIDYAGAAGSAALACYSATVGLLGCRITNCQAAGIQCNGSGFSQFESDTVTGCAGSPLRIAAPYVATLGTGNYLRGNGRDQIDVAAGPITRSAQWRNQGIPYAVNGVIEVGSAYEPTLTIGPGTVLSFAPASALAIGRTQAATLYAVGEPDSITFTGNETLPGSWVGLELHRFARNASRLERCRVLYGGAGGTGILYVDSCVTTVRSNEIAYSSNYCAYLINTDLDPDLLEAENWLHEWAEGFDAVYYAGRGAPGVRH
jgi:hypothetical protein